MMLQKKLIDSETLSRLIEECREEEDRYSIMEEMHSEHGIIEPKSEEEQRIVLHTASIKERSMRELAKVDEQTKLYLEADQVVNSIENTKNQYLQVLDTVNERERSIL